MSPVELPTFPAAAPTAPSPAPIFRERYGHLVGRVRLLSWLSLVWMTIEGAVAIGAGVAASSIALVGFGLDSAIEGFASVIIIWRFTGERVFSHAAEERAQKLVAAQFFLLAPYVGFESVKALAVADHAAVSPVGIALAVGSVVFMPMLGIAKERLADGLGSAATKGEGRQNMLCAYLAGALLVGLLGNAAFGAWWLDPAVGLLIAAVAVKEGIEAWRGEGCCVDSPLGGAGFAAECCEDDCCDPAAAIPSCSLDLAGMEDQRRRYAEIGGWIVDLERSDRELVIALAPSADPDLVEETLRVERECCPFFELDYDRRLRRLAIGVSSEEMSPALDAIVSALGVRSAR